MNNIQQLRDYLADLRKAYDEAYKAGDWTRVDFIGQIIDDTRDRIRAAKAARYIGSATN
jgi:hypothetical protein